MSRFPYNDIISLLDENLEFNLGESTAQDLSAGDLLSPQFLERLTGTRLSYGTSKGNEKLRDSIAKHLKVEPQNILITNGAAAAIFLAILVLCEPGDEVVTVTPNFPPTLDVITALGIRKRTVSISFEDGYRLSPDVLLSSLSPETKLIILVSPHNPSGVALPPADILKILEGVVNKCPKASVLIDETYREATYGDEIEMETAANFPGSVITTASFSKSYGAPGLRVGWLTCSSEDLMRQLTLAKLNTVISCSVIDEIFALEVFNHRDSILKNRRETLAETLALTERWCDENSQYVEWVRPQAGALCCVRLRPQTFDDRAVKEFYRQARLRRVQLASGEWFGEKERVFRLGFGYLSLPQFKEALTHLTSALKASS